jgi:plastocyanin
MIALGAFVVGAGVALLLASTLAPAPAAVKPVPPAIHTVEIRSAGGAAAAGITVHPPELTVLPGDVVQFVNLSNLKASVTFANGTTPFVNLNAFDVAAPGGVAVNLKSDVVVSTATLGSEYPYAVTADTAGTAETRETAGAEDTEDTEDTEATEGGATEQSPVIRIGPRLQSSDS